MPLTYIWCAQTTKLKLEDGVVRFGKNQNWKLGQVREAVSQNSDGEPWNPSMLKNAGPALLKVKQKADKNDPSKMNSNVVSVAPLT